MNAISQAQFVRAPHSNTPLFESLVCETHHAALMGAIVTSCINGSVQGAHILERATIDRYLPPEPDVLLLLTRRSLLEIEPLIETQAIVDEFFVALRVLRRALEAHFADEAEIGASHAQIVNARRLAQAASGLCHEALRAVRALELETPGRLSNLYCDHAQALSRVLIDAERGGTPCLDADSKPFVPKLPQRRQSSRRTLGQNCKILYRQAIIPAYVKDISEGGIGLLRVPFLRADDIVTVELENGRRFKGVVAWTRGEAAGLRFFDALNRSDYLLAV